MLLLKIHCILLMYFIVSHVEVAILAMISQAINVNNNLTIIINMLVKQ